jgi:hypothetical protein
MLTEEDFRRKSELLEKQADLAHTQAERRQIELQLLDLAYQEKKQALERIMQNSKDEAEIENARRDLAGLNANYALDRQGVMKNTAGPMESYLNSLPHTADQMNEALQNLEVQGIDGLVDALSHVGEGWKAMRDIALRSIQDILSQLIKLQLEKMLFNLIGSAAGGLGGGAGSLAGGNAALDSMGVPGFAAGGSFSVMGRMGSDRNTLSLNGLPIANVSYGEKVTVGNDNSRAGPMNFHVTVNGAMSDSQARRTGMQIASGARAEIARASTRGL